MNQYKWLVMSSLQKSIRRGMVDISLNYVDWMWGVDRSYLVYRLGIILIEDVGFTEKDLLLSFLKTEIKKAEIDRLGGKEFVKTIVKQACIAIKDRSACEVLLLAKYAGLSEDVYKKFNSYLEREKKIEFCQKIIRSSCSHYLDKVNSGWLILGNNRFKNNKLPFFDLEIKNEKGKSVDNVSQYIDSWNMCSIDQEIVRLAIKTQRESLILGYPLVARGNFPKDKGMFVEQELFNNDLVETKIGVDILLPAVDNHTREGLSAYAQFIKEDKISKLLSTESLQERVGVFSHILFNIEGHIVNKRFESNASSYVNEKAGDPLLRVKYPHHKVYPETIRSYLRENIKKLNQVRLKSLHNSNII